MNVLMLKTCIVTGGKLGEAGKEATVSEKDGRFLIATGKAEKVAPKPSKPKAKAAKKTDD